MCIVIDINTLRPVFDASDSRHHDFSPVSHWVTSGRGVIVYGGSKHRSELERASYHFVRLFRQLKTGGRAVEIAATEVDKREQLISALTQGTDCDDQHMIAILAASGCVLYCSLDARSYPFVKDRRFYPKRRPVPRIYKSRRHVRLLCDRNIVPLTNLA